MCRSNSADAFHGPGNKAGCGPSFSCAAAQAGGPPVVAARSEWFIQGMYRCAAPSKIISAGQSVIHAAGRATPLPCCA